ncbi:MAG: helix-turn-helix domain-containing protein [Desulfobacteraceae bacterium]|nr:helix-turn-helix domain-containing protein [Desulfobacteraceae bacterium]
MRKLIFFIPDKVPLSALAIPLDVFLATGVFWNLIFEKAPTPFFDVKTVSLDGNPITTVDGLAIKPDASIYDINDSDTIIITPPADLFQNFDEVIPWLIKSHENGTHIASFCTGAFILAQTGLLNGKTATTHWGFVKQFEQLYPRVNLTPQKLITDEGDLFCSGGANAGGDLALYLVAKYFGKEVAFQTARALLMDMDRKSQSPYLIFRFEKAHGDKEILDVQDFLESNFNAEIRVDLLAEKARMSRRTFERRFKNATGDSPLRYLQRVRIENAKNLLEKGQKTFDEITYHVGYGDSSTFSRIFKKTTGLSPNLYKKKYSLAI